jgi:hypothetical protein
MGINNYWIAMISGVKIAIRHKLELLLINRSSYIDSVEEILKNAHLVFRELK